jgi:hypothetical protein
MQSDEETVQEVEARLEKLVIDELAEKELQCKDALTRGDLA